MSNARITVTHKDLPQSITLEVECDLLARAQSDSNHIAQRGIALRVTKEYKETYGENIKHLTWADMEIKAAEETQAEPQGCGCECPGCDLNTYHCHKEERGCYM